MLSQRPSVEPSAAPILTIGPSKPVEPPLPTVRKLPKNREKIMRLLRPSDPIAMAFITSDTPCPAESCMRDRTKNTAIPAPRAGKNMTRQPKSKSLMKSLRECTLQLSPTARTPQPRPIANAAVIITTASLAETAW